MMDRNFLGLCRAPDAGSIVTYRVYAGMCNRFRAHYLAELVAQKIGRSVFPAWIETRLFASDGFDILDGIPSKMAGFSLPNYCLLGLNHIISGAYVEMAQRNVNRLIVLDFDAQWINFNASRSTIDTNFPVKFPIREDVLATARSLIAELSRPCLAVHIRQTDFLEIGKPMNYFEKRIMELINERQQDRFKTLLIASDDLVDLSTETQGQFEHVFVLTPTFSRWQIGVAKEALTHLLVLAAADAFIGSPKSSFSEFVQALRQGMILTPSGSGPGESKIPSSGDEC